MLNLCTTYIAYLGSLVILYPRIMTYMFSNIEQLIVNSSDDEYNRGLASRLSTKRASAAYRLKTSTSKYVVTTVGGCVSLSAEVWHDLCTGASST